MSETQETPKIVAADQTPPPTIPWYQSPQVVAACASIGGGIIGFCAAFHIVIPFSAIEVSAGIASALAVLGGGFALYRRIKVGLIADNDAPRITLH